VAKTALNATNLEALGAARLAELLIELSAGNAAAKRRLRLTLAGAQSPGEVAKEVRKRLATVARSRSFVDWQGIKLLADDLDTMRRAIVETVAAAEPQEALELLWRLMELAPSVFERCDDSGGLMSSVFRHACRDLGEVALQAGADPIRLADRAFEALIANDYGQFDGLIRDLAPALGIPGLEHLKQRMIDLSKTPVQKPAEKDRVTIGWGSGGPIYKDEIKERSRIGTVRLALKEIADLQGDVDAFIAQYGEKARTVPRVAAEIARRLLAAGRVQEAWRAIETAAPRRRDSDRDRDWPAPGFEPDFDWEDARIEVLEALLRPEDAQAARWDCFERALSARHLRDYLKRLPDFDDVTAERKALDYVQHSPNLLHALYFLITWPALDRAADLVLKRADDMDGNHYEILAPAAEALAGKHPLAATVLLRPMIDFALRNGRSGRYKHAARHLLDCAGLASSINDFGKFEPHDAYKARLRREHGRKSAFWSFVDGGST
jgi:hypothetical protein